VSEKANPNNFAIVGLVLLLTALVAVVAYVMPINMLRETPFASSANTGNQMLSRPCRKTEPCVETWTLTSRLGHILETYEEIIGPRNPAFRILGVEFSTSGRPRTWYPDFGKGPRSIIIQLTANAQHNQSLAVFQLGHEVFHLIEPIKPNGTGSYLEEGLASYFAFDYLNRENISASEDLLTQKNYLTAYRLVKQLASLHQDFYPRVKQLRKINRSFSNISSDAIRAAFPRAPALVAQQLAQPFNTGAVSGR
jgi:hypothetical protein